MPKVDRSTLTPEELEILREKDRGYKKTSRKKRGLIEIPVSREMLSMIQKVSKALSLSAPTSSTHGRMDTISQVFEYLLKKEMRSAFYQITKNAPKKLFRLHKTVWYLKNIKEMSEEEIAKHMTHMEELTPQAVIEGNKNRVWSEKHVHYLLDREKVAKRIQQINEA
ncbi:TPA: hypothetical protein ACF6GX_002326 [Raoultella ornithinolytica]|uniref:hypothetical protein n=1 Tax=Enterobacteriaceae TaxID=543 RepID=UPI0029CAB39A|nr:hypothetical protein [Raoultella ornithinolytica]WPJ14634.1 hypothetical protein SH585_12335 [Raoultella ornithinolytica]